MEPITRLTELPSSEATPLLALNYYDRHNASWSPDLRFAAWVAIAYGSLLMASECCEIATVFPFIRQHPRVALAVAAVYGGPLAGSALMLLGGVLALRGQRCRGIMVWSAGLTVVAQVAATFVLQTYILPPSRHLSVPGWLNRYFFPILFNAFVPALLWLFLRKREAM
jgi:hypothetical protein